MSNKIEINIITPTETLEYTNVKYLRAPSIEGLFGVLPGHIPSIIALDIGDYKRMNNIVNMINKYLIV